MISFTDFIAMFNSAFVASTTYNSRSPLIEIVSKRNKVLYCGWNIDRAVRLMAIHSNASGYMHTFDTNGMPIIRVDMPR